MKLVIAFLLGVAVQDSRFMAASQKAPDPCTNYSILDGKLRHKHVVTNVSNAICDTDLIPGWYRFKAGSGEVVTSKVNKLHCGTVSPIWMDDTLPAQGPIVNKKFCFNHHDFSPIGCLWSIMAPIKNCGKYIVYRLPLPYTLCPMAMCTDASITPCPIGQISDSGFMPCKKVRCKRGKWSPSGFEPCGDPYPKVTNVKLTGPEEKTSGDFKHACQITSSDKSADARFNVTWSMDGVAVSDVILQGLQRTAFFNLCLWEGHINEKLTCSVYTYFEKYKYHTSKEITSKSYFGGIKTEPTSIKLSEGMDKTIEVISTLPITCDEPDYDESCQLNLHILSPKVFTAGSCQLALTPSHWNSSTYDARIPVEIASVVDTVVKPDVHTYLAIDVSFNESVTGLQMWANTTQHKSKVIVTDTKPNSCASTGDPHFSQSFSRIYYNLYHQGDFNFASDMRAPIVVQIETNSLYRPTGLPMTSAVAVQTGSDVTIIDTHGGSKTASITSNQPLTSQTVQTCGTNEYQISTSTGHRLNIYTWANALNVYAYFPAGYINYTSHEVCDVKPTTEGNNSFGSSNSISSKVIQLFRTLPSQNLFKGDTLTLKKTPPKQYCSCTQASPGDTNQAKCSMGMKVDDPKIKRPDCNVIQPTIMTAPASKIRPGEEHVNNDPIVPRKWPTASGITKKNALTRCRHDITKFSPKQCATIKGLSIEGSVKSCAEDVLASDSFKFNAAAAEAYQKKCEAKILSDPDSHNNSDILTQQCPNLCNMHGACVKGVCQCEAGWEWTDCSVKSGKAFKITGIQGGMFCDKTISSNCFKPVLNVRNLGNISQCTAKPTAYVKGRPKKAEAKLMGTHGRESSYSVACDFGSKVIRSDFHSKSFRIQIVASNQEKKYINYIIYDGVCQKCVEDLTCFMKQDACLIDGRCYKDGQKKFFDDRFLCDPIKNMNGWTKK